MKLEIQTKFFHFARGIKMPIEKVYLNPWNVLELAINIWLPLSLPLCVLICQLKQILVNLFCLTIYY